MPQYNVHVIESLVEQTDEDSVDLSWWSKRPDRKRGEDGTFIMFGCEMEDNGDFHSVDFAPVHIPKKCVKKYEKSLIMGL